ncbi:MAG: glycosyltransferase family 2 protein [Solirubrobacterales bacterium]
MEAVAYIPNFNGAERLSVLLKSLRGQSGDCRVVVVDNGSTDGSAELVRNEFPEVTVYQLPQNLGFGKALNRAISEIGGDALFLLNNDVECEPGFIAEMLSKLNEDTDMVAGVLTTRTDPGVIDSAGVIADRRTLMAFDYLHDQPVESARSAPPPLAPTGGAALYRREIFEAVGGFDEKIFAYYEDLDLALRLRVAGGRCALASEARASHLHSATLGSRSASKYALTGWSRGYLARRYGIMGSLSGASRTLVWEAIICAGQIMLDGTVQGTTGRIRGWRAGRSLPGKQLPPDGLMELSTRTVVRSRIRQRENSGPSV